MDYSSIKLFSLSKTKMNYLAERQDVLAKSIADVDTPGYQAKDLKPLDFNKMATAFAHKLEMRTTSPSHQQAAKATTGTFRVSDQKNTYETKPIKNSVSTEEQMMKINDNAFEYSEITSLYTKTAGLFKIAIGNR